MEGEVSKVVVCGTVPQIWDLGFDSEGSGELLHGFEQKSDMICLMYKKDQFLLFVEWM